MRRLFWVAVGATAGVLVVRKINKITRGMSSHSSGGGPLDGLSRTVREFVDDVKAGMAERDHELRRALGLSADGSEPEVDPEAVEALLQPGRVRNPL